MLRGIAHSGQREGVRELGEAHQHCDACEDLDRIDHEIALRDQHGEHRERGGGRQLFGFPIVLDDNIPAGTILFGNFHYYGVNVPEGVAVEVSRESGFTSGLIDFRALCIADGKPIVPGAFVKLEVNAA